MDRPVAGKLDRGEFLEQRRRPLRDQIKVAQQRGTITRHLLIVRLLRHVGSDAGQDLADVETRYGGISQEAGGKRTDIPCSVLRRLSGRSRKRDERAAG